MDKVGRVGFEAFLAWVEGDETLVAVDTGYDLAAGQPFPDSTVAAIQQYAEATGKTLSHILLTHHHWDHTANLPFLLEHWPEVEVIAAEASPVQQVTRRINRRETLSLPGLSIELIPTPGHSELGDDLSFWLPGERFLFCGDLAQPQGPSYSLCTGPSPVPFFHDGAAYLQSLEQLMVLDPNAMRTGHGDLLGPEQARQWLRVTYATVNRMAEQAMEVVERYPDKPVDWLCELVYDQIADERHFGFKMAQARKRPAGPEGGLSDYEQFDRPGIQYWIEQARE